MIQHSVEWKGTRCLISGPLASGKEWLVGIMLAQASLEVCIGLFKRDLMAYLVQVLFMVLLTIWSCVTLGAKSSELGL